MRLHSKNLTIQFKQVVYQIQTDRSTYALHNALVTVCEDTEGNISILYKDKPQSYTTIH
jgi:hypothetical protein